MSNQKCWHCGRKFWFNADKEEYKLGFDLSWNYIIGCPHCDWMILIKLKPKKRR